MLGKQCGSLSARFRSQLIWIYNVYYFQSKFIQVHQDRGLLLKVRPEFFNFSFYRPDRPEFSKIEKKIKVLFFNFIFRDRSDTHKKKRAGKFCFLVRYINFTNTSKHLVSVVKILIVSQRP